MKRFLRITDKEHSVKVSINLKHIVYINEEELWFRMSEGSVIYTSYDDMLTIINTISR